MATLHNASLRESSAPIAVFWFRRDLRTDDNTGLAAALKSDYNVLPLFIFDDDILSLLSRRNDPRVEFIHAALKEIDDTLNKRGSGILIAQGKVEEVWSMLFEKFPIAAVFTNEDYEPYARERDEKVAMIAERNGASFHSFKDQVIFAKGEILTAQGKPYTVYTPYSRSWKKALEQSADTLLSPHSGNFDNVAVGLTSGFPSLENIGFSANNIAFPAHEFHEEIIRNYDKQRDFPALDATTHLGVHLRFGTASPRQCVQVASQHNDVWLSELIWREFFMQVLWHFPHSAAAAFRPEYDAVPWRSDEADFERWKTGTTGYPLVDAGMRELVATGYMHNRVRMVTASFLCKHLLLDWRLGERFFAEHLLDYDLSANAGNWQWAAGSGCDAAPYFRVFNPSTQFEKFDKKGEYVRRWVPEFGTSQYPDPMVEHSFARQRAINTYKEALQAAKG